MSVWGKQDGYYKYSEVTLTVPKARDWQKIHQNKQEKDNFYIYIYILIKGLFVSWTVNLGGIIFFF